MTVKSRFHGTVELCVPTDRYYPIVSNERSVCTMRRRTVLGCVGAAVVTTLSGCFTDSVEAKEYPEIPDPLTRRTVVDFVEAYETAASHNWILERETDPDSITVLCDAVFDRETESGFYVDTTCGAAAWHEPTFGSASVADYATYATTYRVDEERVRRAELTNVDGRGDHAVRALNFDDVDHELTLAVTPRANADEPVLDERYVLADGTGLERRIELAVGGTYEVDVDLEAGPSATFEWGVDDRSRGVGIYVTPRGTPDVDALPDDPPVR